MELPKKTHHLYKYGSQNINIHPYSIYFGTITVFIYVFIYLYIYIYFPRYRSTHLRKRLFTLKIIPPTLPKKVFGSIGIHRVELVCIVHWCVYIHIYINYISYMYTHPNGFLHLSCALESCALQCRKNGPRCVACPVKTFASQPGGLREGIETQPKMAQMVPFTNENHGNNHGIMG